jgi:hypothetical protein
MKIHAVLPLALAGLLGTLGANSLFEPPRPLLAEKTDSQWRLPAAEDVGALQKAGSRLKQHFKSAAAKTANQATASHWRFRGVVRQGDRYRALIEQNGKLQRLEVGAGFPDGETLAAISNSGVTLAGENGERELRLHRQH